jgi:hypothetical protein
MVDRLSGILPVIVTGRQFQAFGDVGKILVIFTMQIAVSL